MIQEEKKEWGRMEERLDIKKLEEYVALPHSLYELESILSYRQKNFKVWFCGIW